MALVVDSQTLDVEGTGPGTQQDCGIDKEQLDKTAFSRFQSEEHSDRQLIRSCCVERNGRKVEQLMQQNWEAVEAGLWT